jgi:hypothetical protein
LNRHRSSNRTRPARLFVAALERRTYFSPLAFGAPASFPAGIHPDAIASGDLAGNGITDIVTADYSGGTVSVLMGNGNGTFQPPVQYPVGTNPQSIAVADFNNDGHPDIVTANTGSDTVSVLINNGNGTFAPAVSYAVGIRPESVAVGDFNGDGFADIVTADQGESAISVLTNNGNGTFAAAVKFNTAIGPDGVAVGDLNGDQHPDIVVAIPTLNQVQVLLGNGTGGFAAPVAYSTGFAPRSVLIADLNSDGRPDIVTADLHDQGISLLLGYGNGTFQPDQTSGTGAFPFSVATGDLNGDGRTDIVTANNYDNDVSVLLRNGTGDFAVQHGIRAGQTPADTIAVDVNGDGKQDLVSANFNTDTVTVTLNQTVFVPLIATTNTLTAGQDPVELHNALVLTSTITTVPGAKEVGVVQFFDGDYVLGVAALNKSGVARLVTRSLALGNDVIWSHYGGDGVCAGSLSATQTVTVVSAEAATAFVVPSVKSAALPTPFVPGEKSSATVSIFDQGAGAARGTVGVDLTLIPTDPGNGPSVQVTGATPVGVALAGGQAKNAVIPFTIPGDIATGGYTISAALVPVGGLTSAQVDAASAVDPAVYTAALDFGSVPGHASYTLTRALSNGSTITVSLHGGTGTLTDDGNGIVGLSLAGTYPGSNLTVTTTGPVDVDGISDSSAMGAVNIGAGELSGTINFPLSVRKFTADGDVDTANITFGGGAPSTLSFGAMTDVSLFSAQGIHSLSVAAWTDTSADQINAPWITTLSSAGDFGPGVTISTANGRNSIVSADIGGVLTGGIWSVANDVDKINLHGVDAGWSADVHGSLTSLIDGSFFNGDLAAGYIGSFVAGGTLTDAVVLGGATFGADGLPGGGDDTFHPGTIGSISVGSAVGSVIAAGLDPAVDNPFTVGGTLLPGSVIKAITVTGSADATSKFLAAKLPARVRIAGVVMSPVGDPGFKI